MKKLRNGSVYRSIFSVALIFAFALMPFGAFAASTLGTNMSTTGTFTQTVGSATAAQFQNAAGTVTSLIVDTTNNRVGVNTTNPATVFEVQGTASASYFFNINTIQAGGTFAAASVAYSRFGAGTTGHGLAAADDILVSGLVEFDDNAFFDANVAIGGAPSTKFEAQGTAPASSFFPVNTLKAGGTFGAASVAYSRFGIGTTGHSLAAADDILVSGLVEFDDNAFFDAKVSVSGNFETSGRIRAGTASHSFTGDLSVSSNFLVGSSTASQSSGLYTAEFGGGSTNTATVSILFGSSAASSKGTCFQMKNETGDWVYARVIGTTWTVNSLECNR